MSASIANAVLERWNALEAADAAREVLPCCGSKAWGEGMASRRPLQTAEDVFAASDTVWRGLPEGEWQAAFDSHPRIGERHAHAATTESLVWSSEEQRAAMAADERVKTALAEANRKYEEKFGRVFLVCAAGKPAAEILAILERRMKNTPQTEWVEAAEQQRQITQLRLRRWLGLSE